MAKQARNSQQERRRYVCLRCGHRWKAKQARPPAKCPKCYSPLWAIPRQRKGDYSRVGLHNKLKALHRRLGDIPAMAGVKEDGES